MAVPGQRKRCFGAWPEWTFSAMISLRPAPMGKDQAAAGRMPMPRLFRAAVMGAAAILAASLVSPGHAAEKLRVGKAVPFAWTFTPLDVGIQMGIFARHGLEIEASA